jgi:hypothetical protein
MRDALFDLRDLLIGLKRSQHISIRTGLQRRMPEQGANSRFTDKRLTTLLADCERPEAAEELRPEAEAIVVLATVGER